MLPGAISVVHVRVLPLEERNVRGPALTAGRLGRGAGGVLNQLYTVGLRAKEFCESIMGLSGHLTDGQGGGGEDVGVSANGLKRCQNAMNEQVAMELSVKTYNYMINDDVETRDRIEIFRKRACSPGHRNGSNPDVPIVPIVKLGR